MVDVRLLVNGEIYGGWERAHIRLDMRCLAGSFRLRVSERWEGLDRARPIRPGDACRLLLDGETVITGYVDDVCVDYDDESHRVEIRGRDATGDLVDCSAPSVQWAGRSLEQVARELCKPFGIGVIVDTSCGKSFKSLANKQATSDTSTTTSMRRLKNNEGDSVFETLDAAARCRAVLLTSDGLGNLVITRASSDRLATSLVLGGAEGNILECRSELSDRERYSRITVKGQSGGDDDWNGEAAAHAQGVATDARIRRYRPLTILADEQADGATAQERAQWERSVRYGRGREVEYTVVGWRHAVGLWRPNRLVHVRDEFLGLDEDLLLVAVRLSMDDRRGQLAELTVAPRESMLRIAEAEPTDTGMGAW